MQIFPEFRGLAYSVTKSPEWAITMQQTISGKEIRFGQASVPLWRFTLEFSFLEKKDYDRLLTFYHSVRGNKGSFLYLDPTDCEAVGQNIGVGDGVQTDFQIYRIMDNLKYPIQYPLEMISVQVGDAMADYTLQPRGILRFASAPAKDQIVMAGFRYYYAVRFDGEEFEFEKFAHELWNFKTLQMVTVK